MSPSLDGFYLSDRIHSEDWHAGIKMTDEYFRFLKFFRGGFWLWCDHRSPGFDFATFVREFDLPKWRDRHLRLSPPTSTERDGGHLFEFGTYRLEGSEILASFYSPITETTFGHRLSILDEGRTLRGWNHPFIFHPDPGTSEQALT